MGKLEICKAMFSVKRNRDRCFSRNRILREKAARKRISESQQARKEKTAKAVKNTRKI